MTEAKGHTILPRSSKGVVEFPGVRWYQGLFQGKPGLGVIATQPLPKGTRFEYFGDHLTKAQFDALVKEEKEKKTPHRLAYIVKAKADLYIDAYHAKPWPAKKGLYLGGCVNEPRRNWPANCKLVITHRGGTHAWVVAKRAIKQGEPLTMNYGSSYRRAGYTKS